MNLHPITEIIADIKLGKMVILVDDEDRENEGDLIIAGQFVSPEAVNFMAKYGRGLVCLALTEARCRQLNLPLMVRDNRAPLGTAFTVSIEAATGVTTGISAHDRSRTIQVAVAPDAKPEDIVQPGHIFPLMAQAGGVLVRAGHTEASCDLAHLAGLTPAAVICEILKDDGTMARLPDLFEFSREHGLKIGSIADLIHYRSQNESLVRSVTDRKIQTAHGEFRMHAFLEKISGQVHLALTHGTISRDEETLVRVHQPLSLIDLIDMDPSGHSWTVPDALQRIAAEGKGVLVLLNCSTSASQLIDDVAAKLRRNPNAKMDFLTYGIGAQDLRELGVGRMRLMSTPRRVPTMAGFDLEISGFIPRQHGVKEGS
jgi:3,4-dihydroxy 2-butanone 4-phosphate synthase / GTP cyclohydrolase II